MNKASGILILSHALAGLIGWNLMIGSEENRADGDYKHSPGELVQEPGTQRTRSSRSHSKPPSEEAIQMLWSSLPDQQLTTEERIEAQRRLLAEWAKTDLEGAIHAMLAESWWSGKEPSFLNGSLSGSLGGAFTEVFQERPDESWDLISSGIFGVGAALLRNTWYQAMAYDSVALASKFAEAPGGDREKLLRMIGDAGQSDQDTLAKVTDILMELPKGKISTRELMRILPGKSLEEARASFEVTSDISTREGELAAFQFAEAQFIGENFEGLRSYEKSQIEKYREFMEVLPRESQGRFLYGLLAGSFSIETVMGTKERALDLLNLMVEGEHWDSLDQAQSLIILDQGMILDFETRAKWAAALPDQDEVAGVFETSVVDYLRKEEASAMEWIESLPPGRWRDEALAASSRQLLRRGRRIEESRQALEKIKDPTIQQAAGELHDTYEGSPR